MITTFTGMPGNGKTLFMLTFIKEKAERENRQVYYANIQECNVPTAQPWIEFDPVEWMHLPYGSIIVIDEAGKVFPRKPNGATLPEHYMELTEHRKYGFDIFLVTQHPSFLDNIVRKLSQQHFHSVRKFGMARATIYEWANVQSIPEGATAQKLSINTLHWKFNKQAYGWYKSAEMHTVKTRVPMKIIVVAAFVIGMIGFAYWSFSRYVSRSEQAPGESSEAVGSGMAPGSAGVLADGSLDPVADAKRYMHEATPRIVGLAFTAPKYDKITEPDAAPIPAMCIQVGQVTAQKDADCRCYSQQATKLEVPFNMCMEFARNGFFREFDADNDRKQQDRSDRSVAALSRVPDRPLSSGSQWAMLGSADASSSQVSLPSREPEPRERSAQVHDGSIYPPK